VIPSPLSGGAEGRSDDSVSSSRSSGGALLSISSLRRCNSCLSSVGWTCDDDEGRYSGAAPEEVAADCGGKGGSGFACSLSLLVAGRGALLGALIVVDEVVVADRVSSPVCPVARCCVGGAMSPRDDDDAIRKGGGGCDGAEDEGPAAIYGGSRSSSSGNSGADG
jgi:hypothetical protein